MINVPVFTKDQKDRMMNHLVGLHSVLFGIETDESIILGLDRAKAATTDTWYFFDKFGKPLEIPEPKDGYSLFESKGILIPMKVDKYDAATNRMYVSHLMGMDGTGDKIQIEMKRISEQLGIELSN